jgi:hypothetical protein
MPSASETSSIFAAIESAALEDAAMTAASTRETRDDDADGNGRPSEDSTTDGSTSVRVRYSRSKEF